MAKHVRERVQNHRDALRKSGLRLIQLWVPDTRQPNFEAECHRQLRLVAKADTADIELSALMENATSDIEGWIG